MKTNENMFAEGVFNAFAPNSGASFFNDVKEVDEHEVNLRFTEAMMLGASFKGDCMMIAEMAGHVAAEKGIVDAIFAESAVGGFFKSILEKLIKLWEKVKGFFTALAGRFKSADKYMKELPTLVSMANQMKKTEWTDKVEVKVPKHDWKAIFGEAADGKEGIIRTVFSDKPIMFEEKYNGVSVEGMIAKGKDIVTSIEANKADYAADKDNNITEGKVKSIKGALAEMQKHSNADDWSLFLYKAHMPTYKSDMKLDNGKKVKEEIGKVFSNEKKSLKGNEIKTDEYMKALYDGIEMLNYTDLQKGVEKGTKFFKEKVDELKDVLKEVENAAVKARDSNKEDKDDKLTGAVSEASNLMTSYSSVLTTFSTTTIMMFNQSKVVLDRALSSASDVLNMLNKARKQAGINISGDK